MAFCNGSVVKKLPANANQAVGLIPGLERCPGEENSHSLQYSCLGSPMDRAQWVSVHGVAKESDMTEGLNTNNKYKYKYKYK